MIISGRKHTVDEIDGRLNMTKEKISKLDDQLWLGSIAVITKYHRHGGFLNALVVISQLYMSEVQHTHHWV